MCEFKRIFRLTSHLETQVEGCGVLQGSSKMLLSETLARWPPMPLTRSLSRSGLACEAISGSGTTSHQLRLGRWCKVVPDPDIALESSPERLEVLIGGVCGHLTSSILEEPCNTPQPSTWVPRWLVSLKMRLNSHTSKPYNQTIQTCSWLCKVLRVRGNTTTESN